MYDARGELRDSRGYIREKEFLMGLYNRYQETIENMLVYGEDENISDLKRYFPKGLPDLDLDKIKIWLLLLQEDRNNEIPKVLSFLESKKYGWYKSKYLSNNSCSRDCRRGMSVSFIQDTKLAKATIDAIREIFFDDEYGWITLLVFSYCLAGLFRSMLSSDTSPLYLQIACERDTVLYELIKEIVSICDVNAGIFDKCKKHSRWSCGNEESTVIYPTDLERTLDKISYYRDMPIIIDGHGNVRGYHALLREVANTPSKRNRFSMGDVLPIFICPEIKISFNNTFDLNLTEMQVSDDYLDLIKENKHPMASLVYDLLRYFIECLFPEDGSEEDRQKKYIEQEYPYSSEIKKSIESIRGAYPSNFKVAKNMGVLSFFFTGFLRALDRLFDTKTFTSNERFRLRGSPLMMNVVEHINSLRKDANKSLYDIHKKHTHAPMDSIAVEIEGIEPNKVKQIEKKARRYAIGIVKSYQSFGASIAVSNIKVKGERYIFDISTIEGTRQYKIFKEAGDVQATTPFKYFKPAKEGTSISLVASEELLKENSLAKILNDPLFKDSKHKIPFAVGYDIMGDMVVSDLAKVRHMLVGGQTGSGKSTGLYSLLLSIVCKQSIDNVNLLIFDFGFTYLSAFKKVPHLSHSIIDDKDVGFNVIMELVDELERRRDLFRTNKSLFNKQPVIFCVIDEFPDFIDHGTDRARKKELQAAITKLLAVGRGAEIHLVLAAQDPTEENMKCRVTNLGTAMAFRCEREHNSRVLIGESGAEKLLGNGDMLFKAEGSHVGIKSIQGAYIEEKDLVRMLNGMTFSGTGEYKFVIDEMVTARAETESNDGLSINTRKLSAEDDFDRKTADVIMLLLKQGEIANSDVIRLLRVNFHTADTYMDKLVEYGLIPTLTQRKKRMLIPKHVKDIPANVLELLAKHGFTEADVAEAINKRAEGTTPSSV